MKNPEQSSIPKKINYPFLPEGKMIMYVPADNEFMKAARKFAEENSLDKGQKTGSALVKDGKLIGLGANGSTYHEDFGCERKRLNIPTGEGYELCEGCDPKNHSEAKAIASATEETHGADLYLWGHWWCCQPCWDRMKAAGINNVYLQEGSEVEFNRENPMSPMYTGK